MKSSVRLGVFLGFAVLVLIAAALVLRDNIQPASPYPQMSPLEKKYQQAEALMAARDVAGARALYEQAAAEGYVKAQVRIASMLMLGRDVRQDLSTAYNWFYEAAKQGNAEAEERLCTMYLNGMGVPEDDKKAFEWCRKSAEHGYAPGQNELCGMYIAGLGTSKDEAAAFTWCTKAVFNPVGPPIAAAQIRLARMYLFGNGTPVDEKKAAALILDAAKRGSVPALRWIQDYREDCTERGGRLGKAEIIKACDFYTLLGGKDFIPPSP